MAEQQQSTGHAGILDIERIPLAKMSLSPWRGRTDTKGLVSAVMIALAMVGLAAFGERLDTIVTGGLFPVSGRIITFTLIGFATMMFGLVPGLIVAWVNPFISVATGGSPLAPFFFFTNTLQVLAALIIGMIIVRNVVSYKFTLGYSALATVLLTLVYIPLHIFYFRLPALDMLALYGVQGLFTLILPPFLLLGLLRVVKRAGFIEE